MQLLVVSAVSALALGACGGSGSAETTSDKSVVWAIGNPDHLTPGRQLSTYQVINSLWTPLTLSENSGTVTPLAAESVTSVDMKTWTIKLKAGWKFQNGEAVTAKSYVDTWNYVAYAPNKFENSTALSVIEGYADLNPVDGKPKVKKLSGAKVIDDTTISVTLTAPDRDFPAQISQGKTAFYPMPSVAFDDMEAFDKAPIGNGPFKLSGKWVANKSFTVKSWDGYGGEKPSLDAVEFRPYANLDTAYTDVQAGNVDLAFVQPTKYTSGKADFGDRFITVEPRRIDYLGFPAKDQRYTDKRVRAAISMAIDRKAISKAIYGGLYVPATSLTPAASTGNPDGVCGELCTFDPVKAKKLLADAGGFTGKMPIVFPGGNGLDALFEAYANQLRQNLGVDAVAMPTTDYPAFLEQTTKQTLNGPFFSGWGSLTSSPKDILSNMFGPLGGCAPCSSFYRTDAVDKLLVDASSAKSDDEASALYKKVQERILEDFPVAPTFSSRWAYVVSPKIKDLNPVLGSPYAATLTVK